MLVWFFTWRRVRQLKKQAYIPHKLKLNTQRLKSECVYEIKEKYKPIMDTFEMLNRKLAVKKEKLKIIETDRDEHGIEKEKKEKEEDDLFIDDTDDWSTVPAFLRRKK